MPDNTGNAAENTIEYKGVNIRNKTIGAFILLFVLFIPMSAALYYLGRYQCWRQETQHEEMNQEVLSRIARYGNQRYLAAEAELDDHIRKEVDIAVSFLQEYVTKNRYNGPETFKDGFVVYLNGDKVALPVHISGDDAVVDKRLIEDSILSDRMRTVSADEGSLSFGRICDDAVYVQITPDEEHVKVRELYRENIRSAMETATEMSGRMTLLVYEKDGQPAMLEQLGDSLLPGGVADLGLTMETLKSNSRGTLRIGGRKYRYICTSAEGEWIGHEKLYIIQVFLLDRIISQLLLLTFMICLLMFVFFVTIITYAVSEEGYIQKKELDSDEAKKYNPKRIRRRFLYSGIISILLIFAVAFITQSVIQMRQLTANGKLTLHLLAGQRDREAEGIGELLQEIRENRYLNYGTMIASFMEDCDKDLRKEKLRVCCEITGADFMMMFDHEGHEILCSKDYDNFSIDRGLGENSSDFRRLLYGIEGIIHPVSTDNLTGLRRQMIGVTMDCAADGEGHGALILALMPDTTARPEEVQADEESPLLLPSGTLCFEAEKRTGDILYSSEPALEEKNVEDIGLKMSSLQGGYMDFDTILGVKRFIVTSEEGDKGNVYCYAVDNSMLRKENLWYGVNAACVYTVGLIILLMYLLREYNDESYIKVRSGLRLERQREARDRGNRDRGNRDRGKIKNLFLRITGWDSMLPEKRAGVVLMTGILVLLQVWVAQMLGNYLMRGTEQTLLDYLLNGDWVHGFNMFALCSIVLCVATAYLVIVIAGWLLQLIAGFVGAKGETICSLLNSLIRFVSGLIVIIMSLHYVGLLNSEVLASMGIGSLAVSLGAKDTIADILAGILIVFNETVRVGDIVEYQGITAEVVEVRIQNTRLSTLPDHDIMIVRNQAITSIINKSRTDSVYRMKLQVHAGASLEKIEALMNENLPRLRDGCHKIIGTPEYLGVVALGHLDRLDGTVIPTITLQVNARCHTKDRFDVTVYMNKELHLLFAREGIEVF